MRKFSENARLMRGAGRQGASRRSKTFTTRRDADARPAPDLVETVTSRPDGEWSRGYDGHRRAQAGMGLRLTPAERLHWLEEARETLRRWQGRARRATQPEPPPAPTAGQQG